MLQVLTTPPTDLGKSGEVRKHSGALDRITGDHGDVRVYASADGTKNYLRIWEGSADAGVGRWYLCVPAPKAAATEPAPEAPKAAAKK